MVNGRRWLIKIWEEHVVEGWYPSDFSFNVFVFLRKKCAKFNLWRHKISCSASLQLDNCAEEPSGSSQPYLSVINWIRYKWWRNIRVFTDVILCVSYLFGCLMIVCGTVWFDVQRNTWKVCAGSWNSGEADRCSHRDGWERQRKCLGKGRQKCMWEFSVACSFVMLL